MRHVDTVDVEDVHVLPRLRRVGGAGEGRGEDDAAELHEARPRRLARDARGRAEHPLRPGDGPGARPAQLRTKFTIKEPRLWAPRAPELYGLTVGAVAAHEVRSTYRLTSASEDLRAAGRRDPAERQAPNLRGASVMEDDIHEGGALSQRTRALLLNRLEARRDDHALAIPPPPGLHRGARPRRDHVLGRRARLPDSERVWEQPGVRSLATRAATRMVENNVNHPSILTWSLASSRRARRAASARTGPGSWLRARRLRRDSRHGRHASRGPRPPVAHRRAAHHAGAPVPRRAGRERLLRLVPLGDREPARPARQHDVRPQRLPRPAPRRRTRTCRS